MPETAATEPERPEGEAVSGPIGRGWIVFLPFLGLLPIAILGWIAVRGVDRAVRELVEHSNLAAARVAADLVGNELEQRVVVARLFASEPEVRRAAAEKDVAAARERLRALVDGDPRIIRAFLTDPDGLLWTDHPLAPESLGRRFDHRGWYRGVRDGGWQPYVSDVYRRHAEPQLLLVTVACPVTDPDTGSPLAILCYQLGLEALTEWLRKFEGSDSQVLTIVDSSGAIVAHPGIDSQRVRYTGLADHPGIRRAAESGVAGTISFRDPIHDAEVLGAAVPVDLGDGRRWVVVCSVPRDLALAPLAALRRRILLAGGLLAAVALGWSVVLSARTKRVRELHRDLAARHAELGRTAGALEKEILDHRESEAALQRLRLDLEAQVEARTAELRETHENLRRAARLEAVGKLAGGVAHEFNNLLTVVLARFDTLRSLVPEEGRTALDQLGRAARRAADLTGRLLAFGRKQILAPRAVDLAGLFQRARPILERVVGEDVELEILVAADLPRVRFDPGQLEQVVYDLALHAREAMPRGGWLSFEARWATATETGGPERVALVVLDSGEGMDPSTLERLFEPFGSTRAAGGGLGLATAHGILHQSGGSIEVESSPGRGSRFTVLLPVAGPDETPAEEIEIVSPQDWELPGAATILLVEDDEGVREVLAEILGEDGYRVETAASAEEGLEIFLARPRFDAVLSDVVLPGRSGVDLVGELVERDPRLRVALMSGYPGRQLSRYGLEAIPSHWAYFRKPIEIPDLLVRLRELLRGAREGEESGEFDVARHR